MIGILLDMSGIIETLYRVYTEKRDRDRVFTYVPGASL
jgi:hypothetical protein